MGGRCEPPGSDQRLEPSRLLQILDSMAHVENEAEQLIGALWAIMASDSQQRGLGAITPADVITEILTSHPWWTERPDYAMHAYAEDPVRVLSSTSITASRLSVRSGTACTPSARICALNGTPSGASDERVLRRAYLFEETAPMAYDGACRSRSTATRRRPAAQLHEHAQVALVAVMVRRALDSDEPRKLAVARAPCGARWGSRMARPKKYRGKSHTYVVEWLSRAPNRRQVGQRVDVVRAHDTRRRRARSWTDRSHVHAARRGYGPRATPAGAATGVVTVTRDEAYRRRAW